MTLPQLVARRKGIDFCIIPTSKFKVVWSQTSTHPKLACCTSHKYFLQHHCTQTCRIGELGSQRLSTKRNLHQDRRKLKLKSGTELCVVIPSTTEKTRCAFYIIPHTERSQTSRSQTSLELELTPNFLDRSSSVPNFPGSSPNLFTCLHSEQTHSICNRKMDIVTLGFNWLTVLSI